MKPEEIKVGTKFIYNGSDFQTHNNIIQTITKIEDGRVYTDYNNNTFLVGLLYMNDCKILLSPNDIKPKLSSNGEKVNLDEYLKNNLKLDISLRKRHYWDETELVVKCSLYIGDTEITTAQDSIDI